MLDHVRHQVDVRVVGHGDVQHAAGPALGLVAHPQDLAVAHVPQGALDVPHLGHAQPHVLHGADRLPEVHGVTDAQLVLGHHKDAGEVVLHQGLRAEGQGHTGDARRGDHRGDVEAQFRDDHEDRDGPHDDGGHRSQHRTDGAGPQRLPLRGHPGVLHPAGLAVVEALDDPGLRAARDAAGDLADQQAHHGGDHHGPDQHQEHAEGFVEPEFEVVHRLQRIRSPWVCAWRGRGGSWGSGVVGRQAGPADPTQTRGGSDAQSQSLTLNTTYSATPTSTMSTSAMG